MAAPLTHLRWMHGLQKTGAEHSFREVWQPMHRTVVWRSWSWVLDSLRPRLEEESWLVCRFPAWGLSR
jgi:hypothetical protein